MKQIFAILLMTCLLSCKGNSQDKSRTGIGERSYMPLKLNQKIDTIDFKDGTYSLKINGNMADGSLSAHIFGNKLAVYRLSLKDRTVKKNEFKYNKYNRMYNGHIGGYTVFGGGFEDGVMLYRDAEEIQVKFKDTEIWGIDNLTKDSVVFFGYNQKAKQLGLFKESVKAFTASRKINPLFFYDMSAKDYRTTESLVFSGAFDIRGDDVLYFFDTWSRVLHLNSEKQQLVKLVDTCGIMVPEKTTIEGMPAVAFPNRKCEYNVVNAFTINNYIVVCPRKVISDDGLRPLDIYDTKTGAYKHSIKYGLPSEGDKYLLYVACNRDDIVAIYGSMAMKTKIITVTIPKKDLINHIEKLNPKQP